MGDKLTLSFGFTVDLQDEIGALGSRYRGLNGNWSERESADRERVMALLKARGPTEFSGKTQIWLFYPGAGWDFQSFWGLTSPDCVAMFDPAPVVNAKSTKAEFNRWKKRFEEQLADTKIIATEEFVFDFASCVTRMIDDKDWDRILARGQRPDGFLRPAFSVAFIKRGGVRVLTFVAALFEEMPILANIPVCEPLKIYQRIPRYAHIVYEHKSMLSESLLKDGVMDGGCLIWGLPRSSPTVQFKSVGPGDV